ncbi:MAG: 2-dehydropantoate 2-reductase [Solirubrobacterales bacterium]|nr:2-dehydropantoate 2-reductase [Solirubrobacterales bacterium]
MAIERVCIIGAGTIGSLYAGHLADVAEVLVLTRRPEHADALNQHGLRVTGKSERHVRVTASTDPGELPEFDLGIVATKATDLEAIAQRLEGRFAGAAMMTIQNGLGAEEVMRRHGEWRLISAVTFMSGNRRGDAEVEYELDTATWMGPYAGTETPFAIVRDACELLLACGLQAEAMSDLRPAQWSKLIFNAAVNGVAALTELPHVAEFAAEARPADLGHLVHDLIAEGVRVADAAGVELHDDPWEMNRRAVTRGETNRSDYAHLPSMLEDVLARRPTEVDAISGALVREGERVGVPAPLNAAVWRLVRGKERSWAGAARTSPEEVRA